MPITGLIPQSKSPSEAFIEALKDASAARQARAQAIAQEQKNPYVGRQSEADLINQQNINKYYGPNIKSEMGLRSADTALKMQLLNNPGLGGTGAEHTAAVLALLEKKHPEIAQNLHNQVIQSNQQQPVHASQPMNPMQAFINSVSPKSNPNYTPVDYSGSSPQEAMPQQQEQPQQEQQAPQQQQAPQPQEETQQDRLKRIINADITSKNNSGSARGSAGLKTLQAVTNAIQEKYPKFSDEQVAQARDAYLDGRESDLGLPPAEGQLKSLLNKNYKFDTDVGQRAQERFANTLEDVFKKADEVTPGAFKFAGAAGKLKGGVETLKASVGENDPDYLDYMLFTRQIIPALATEILRTGGANSTNQQKLLAIVQANPITLDSNPTLAPAQFKFLQSLYRGIGKSITKGPQAIHNRLQNESSETAKSSPSQDNDPWGIR